MLKIHNDFMKKIICFALCSLIFFASFSVFLVPEADAVLPLLIPAGIAASDLIGTAILGTCIAGWGYFVTNDPFSDPASDDPDNPDQYVGMALNSYCSGLLDYLKSSSNPDVANWANGLESQYSGGITAGQKITVPASVYQEIGNYLGTHQGLINGVMASSEFSSYSFTGTSAEFIQNYYYRTNMGKFIFDFDSNFPYDSNTKTIGSANISYLSFSLPDFTLSLDLFSNRYSYSGSYHRSSSVGTIDSDLNNVFDSTISDSSLYIEPTYWELHFIGRGTGSCYLNNKMAPCVPFNSTDIISFFAIESNFISTGEISSLDMPASDVIGGLEYDSLNDTYDLYSPGTDVANYIEIDGVSVPVITNLTYDDVIDGVGTGSGTGEGEQTQTGDYSGVLSGISGALTGLVTSIGSLITTVTTAISDFFDLSQPINLEPFRLTGVAFTNKFPFSLPWDFYRGISSIADLPDDPPSFSLALPIPGGQLYEFEVNIPPAFIAYVPFIRGALLFIFIISLILATRKLLGGDV